MAFRELAGGMARNTAGIWKAVAEAVDPKPVGARPRPEPGPSPAPPTSASGAGVEESQGQMIVPLDTWTRILEQVGHIHEAGQQLADAKERAARAETENRFLREQLADLKAQRRTVRRAAAPAAPKTSAVDGPTAQTSGAASARAAVGTRIVRVRQTASRWLSPQ